MRIRTLFAGLAVVAVQLCSTSMYAQLRGDQVLPTQQADSVKIRNALGDDAAEFWIYEDVKSGFDESQRTGKPLLISIR